MSLTLNTYPSVDPATFGQLADCQYIQNKEGIIFCGKPGTGKAHLATIFGLEACEKRVRVRLYTAAGQVNDLTLDRLRSTKARKFERK